MKHIIRRLNALPESWISVETVTRQREGVRITFTVRQGRRGKPLEAFTIACRNAREMRVSDLDGGGIRLYSKSHPAAKQYSDRRATLRVPIVDDEARVLGLLLAAHTDVVDDWIPFDRYVPRSPSVSDPLTLRGPAFLLRRYAFTLTRAGYRPRLVIRPSDARARVYQVLHFGDSFVVAESFEGVTGNLKA